MRVLTYLKGLGSRLLVLPLFLIAIVVMFVVWLIAGNDVASRATEWVYKKL